jgi:MFS family permease
LRFYLLPGTLGIIFTISGLAGGIFSLTAPLFVKRWGKLRIITTVMYLSAPLMTMIGFAPTLWLAVAGEYTRSFMRTLIEPVYAAFAMEQVSDRYRATLSGFYSVTWSIGFSVGPTAAGWLQTNVNLSTTFVFGAICLSLSASLLLLLYVKLVVAPQAEGHSKNETCCIGTAGESLLLPHGSTDGKRSSFPGSVPGRDQPLEGRAASTDV